MPHPMESHSSCQRFFITDSRKNYGMGLGQRIKSRREELKISRAELAKRADMPYPTLAGIENGDQTSSPKTWRIAEILNCPVQWLETGDGPRELNALMKFYPGHISQSGASYDLGDDHVSVGGPVNPEDMVFVPSVKGASLAAGTGEVVYDLDEQVNAVAFRRDWMQSKNLNPDRCKVWKVRGDSMEPRYSAGDALLIDMSDRTPRHGKSFALVGDEGLRVKQLLRGSESWIMHSFNPDKARYPDEPILDQNYAIIGRVRARSGDED